MSGSGILHKLTAQDTCLVNLPSLTPHLQFHPIDGQRTLLVSETFNTLLNGEIYSSLLPLLDGQHSHGDICKELDSYYSESEIRNVLLSLSNRGYIVSGEHSLEQGAAAYWTSLGASPCWAQMRLDACRVSIDGDKRGALARQIESCGITVTSRNENLSIYVCADYLEDRFSDINRKHLETGVPWILVKPNGIVPLFGPIFQTETNGPCWACLVYRLQGHQEVHNFLRNRTGDRSIFVPRASQPAVSNAVLSLAASEIAKWQVFDKSSPLTDHVISMDSVSLRSERHFAMLRPQCFECGDPRNNDPNREPHPVELKSSPKKVVNSGGTRSMSPEQTLKTYSHLVSPVSGVVTWLKLDSDESDSWFHVHTSGSNFALRSKSLGTLRRSLRSKSVGKGSTRKQSEASALCEAIERYSCAFHGDEITRRGSYSDFSKSQDAPAIHPNEVQLFSENQISHARQINARNHPYNVIPDKFNENAIMDWSPVWSLTQDRHRYLPTSILYSMPAERRELANMTSDSNGCAAGNTLEEAILQGFLELVERDAFAVWWYNRLQMPQVNLDSFDDEYLSHARDYYRQFGRDIWVLDVTNDLGIPVFVAISRRTDSDSDDIMYAAGAHTDPHIAALRAICELNQFLNLAGPTGLDGTGYRIDDPLCLWWFENVKVATQPYLAPSPDLPQRNLSDYRIPKNMDVLADLTHCRKIVESKGMEFLVLDNTRPDIRMPVVRVIVPGLRHFWERFAPGRLFEVPVEMGWRATQLDETQLNPIPVMV